MAARALAFLALGLAAAARAEDRGAPWFEVDLDIAPEERWTAAVDGILDLYGWEGSFANVANYVKDTLPADTIARAEQILEAVNDNLEYAYGDEIKGIHAALEKRGYGNSSAGSTGLSLGELTALNLLYEVTVWCTSIVAETRDGAILHGRNLDYTLKGENGMIYGMQNITANIRFTRRGVTRFQATTFVGYVGILTGMKPSDAVSHVDDDGGWTVSVDQREYLEDEDIPSAVDGIAANVAASNDGGLPIGFFLRDALDQVDYFDDALPRLANEELIAPAYIILGGTSSGQGAVITRDRQGPDNSHHEGVWMLDSKAWYRIETNFDHWLTEADVKSSDGTEKLWRRNNATRLLDAVGPAITPERLDSILDTVPVRNRGTQYTTIMSASYDIYDTTVRESCWEGYYTPCSTKPTLVAPA